MHFLGLAGMPRRIPDYPDAYAGWNSIASYGSYVSVCGAIFFFYIVYRTLTSDTVVEESPWDVWEGEKSNATMEWMLASPPGFHTFAELMPILEPVKGNK